REQLRGVERALVQRVAGLDVVAGLDQQAGAARELVLLRLRILLRRHRLDRHLRATLRVLDVHLAADLRETSRTLRVAGLEDLDDAREAVRDVRAGDTAGVERPHRQLRARLADRLRGDDADRVADLRHLARGKERAVARLAHARLRAALQHRANGGGEALGVLAELFDDLAQARHRDLLALLGDERLRRLARRERLVGVLRHDAAGDALVQAVRQV